MAGDFVWRETDPFVTGTHAVTSLANSRGFAVMAAGGEDGSIDLRRVERTSENVYPGIQNILTPKRISAWSAHQKAVTSLAFHAGRNLLISGSADGKLKFWPTLGGALIQEVNLQAPIHAVRAFPAQNAIVVGTSDTAVQMLEVPTGRQLARFETPNHAGYGYVSVFGDERFIAGGCRDGFTCVWEVKSGKLIQQVQGGACVFRPGVNVLVTARKYDFYDKVYVWELQQKWLRITIEQKAIHEFELQNILDIALSSDGRFLAVLTTTVNTRNITIFATQTLTMIQKISIPDKVTALHFGLGRHEILAGLASGHVTVWQYA